MTHRVIRIVLGGLVIATTAALLTGCPEAAPSRPVPAWSPPNWMHGTWKESGGGSSGTIVASRYNLKITANVGASSVTVDLADIAERGLYTIYHDAGVWHVTGDLYYELILTSGSANPIYLWFTKHGSDQIGLWQTDPLDPNSVIGDPAIFTKQ